MGDFKTNEVYEVYSFLLKSFDQFQAFHALIFISSDSMHTKI